MNRLLFTWRLILLISLPVYSQWQVLNKGEFNIYGFDPIDFINDDAGWTHDSRQLYRTYDFGNTWTEVKITGVENFEIESMDFISDSVGWILVNDYTAERSKILFTDDGGGSWELKYEYYTNTQGQVLAPDENHLYLALQNGQIARSIDGGEKWEYVSLPDFNNQEISSICFINKDVGVVSGDDSNSNTKFIARTFDGGENWTEIITDFEDIIDLQFINNSIAYFIGFKTDEGFSFYESRDTCRSWTEKSMIASYGNFRFVSSDSVYSFLEDSIRLSTNAGSTWEALPSLAKWNNSGIYINSRDEALLTSSVPLGGYESGRFEFRSSDRGESWDISMLTYPFTSTFFIDENKGFAAGGFDFSHEGRGNIFMTVDGGESWKLNYNMEWEMVNSIQFVDDMTGFVLTVNGIYKSIDTGNDWDKVYDNNNIDFDPFNGNDIYFVDGQRGWVAGYQGSGREGIATILSTIDGGLNWDQVWQIAEISMPSELNSVHFADSVGWAVGSGGMILKCMEAGIWQQANSPTDLPFEKVFFSDKNHGWIGGGFADRYFFMLKLLRTVDGGENWEIFDFDYHIRDMYFQDSLQGWIVGFDTSDIGNSDLPPGQGIILHTADGGISWEKQVEGLSGRLEGIYFRDGVGWAVGNMGLVLRTTDGTNWVDQSAGKAYPGTFSLSQNHPNPFIRSTVISYKLGSVSNTPLKVDLSIYNIEGKKIATLVSGVQPAGTYRVEWDASSFAGGVYFCRLKAGDFVQEKKLMLINY